MHVNCESPFGSSLVVVGGGDPSTMVGIKKIGDRGIILGV